MMIKQLVGWLRSLIAILLSAGGDRLTDSANYARGGRGVNRKDKRPSPPVTVCGHYGQYGGLEWRRHLEALIRGSRR